MNRIILITITLLTITGCGVKNTSTQDRKQAKLDFFENVFNPDNIASQTFEIDPNKDTLLIGNKGTQLKIFANNFVIPDTHKDEPVLIELKEITHHYEWVLGNLTTTESYPGNHNQLTPLYCEKMLYVNATSNGIDLEIDITIGMGIIIPTDSVDDNALSIRKGMLSDSLIRWIPNENITIENSNAMSAADYRIVKVRSTSKNTPHQDLNDNDLSNQALNQIRKWKFDPLTKVGDTLIHDTLRYVTPTENDPSFDVYFSYVEAIWLDSNAVFNFGDYSDFVRETVWQNWKNDNYDFFRSHCLLNVKETGWIGINRSIHWPPKGTTLRTASIILEVENSSDFEFVHATLLFNDGNMYIPGHQRKNGTFDFFLDFGFEAVETAYRSLPVGKATAIVSAYKNGQPYFGMLQFEMESKNNISCRLEETSLSKIKEILIANTDH